VDADSFIRRCVAAGAAALGAFGVVFWVCYLFSIRDTLRALRHWAEFIIAIGAEEGSFWERHFNSMLVDYNYLAIFVIWVVSSVLFAVEISRRGGWRSRSAIVLLANLVVGTLLALSLLKRGAGTTLFEVASILVGLAGIALAGAFGRERNSLVPAVVLVMLAGFALTQFPYKQNWFIAKRWQEQAEVIWGVHNQLRELAEPVIFVRPDRSYDCQTVEELMDIGLGLSGEWNFLGGPPLEQIDLASERPPIARAREMQSRFSPRVEITTRVPAEVPAGNVVVWCEKWDAKADRPLREVDESERTRWQPLVAWRDRSHAICKAWRMPAASALSPLAKLSDSSIINVCHH
jgi:hypothetical protein